MNETHLSSPSYTMTYPYYNMYIYILHIPALARIYLYPIQFYWSVSNHPIIFWVFYGISGWSDFIRIFSQLYWLNRRNFNHQQRYFLDLAPAKAPRLTLRQLRDACSLAICWENHGDLPGTSDIVRYLLVLNVGNGWVAGGRWDDSW